MTSPGRWPVSGRTGTPPSGRTPTATVLCWTLTRVRGREETETCYVGAAGTLVTHNCKLQLCPVCRFLQFPVDFQLRGVCLESPVDKFYVLHNSTELHGHSGSLLRWVEEESSWTITRKRETLARLRSESRSLPLGKHLWTFTSGCSDPGAALLL